MIKSSPDYGLVFNTDEQTEAQKGEWTSPQAVVDGTAGSLASMILPGSSPGISELCNLQGSPMEWSWGDRSTCSVSGPFPMAGLPYSMGCRLGGGKGGKGVILSDGARKEN